MKNNTQRILKKLREIVHKSVGKENEFINIPSPTDFDLPQVSIPKGYTKASLYEYLSSFQLEGSGKEIENYLKQDFMRFMYTFSLVPKGNGKLLEIGSNPYFTSLLIEQFTNYKLYCSNYFDDHFLPVSQQRMINTVGGNDVIFEFNHFNIEKEIPFEQNFFDGVLFCEVLEHLCEDPYKALLNIKKVLKKDGYLILTTPNVSRLENVARMISGVNIYDPYSGYGIYGRHNREYNKHELNLLLSRLGYSIDVMFTADVHQNSSTDYCDSEILTSAIKSIKNREYDLGQYIFVLARNTGEANPKKPNWLFRSYSIDELAD